MEKDIRAAAEKWDEFDRRQRGKKLGLRWWEAGSAIQEHINLKISGEPRTGWIDYTLQTYFRSRMPLSRCLVLGCGGGELERALSQRKAFLQCDAYDVSERSIATARQKAKEQSIDNIHYHIADINQLDLETDCFDMVWIGMAMHHFVALEHISEQIKAALKRDGLLILLEYVGPNRFQFPLRQKEVANSCLQLLPIRYRAANRTPLTVFPVKPARQKNTLKWYTDKFMHKIKDRSLLQSIYRRLFVAREVLAGRATTKSTIDFPTEGSVVADDPSEAVRSAEILPVLRHYFEIVEEKNWGGNIVQYLLHGIAGNFTDDDENSQALIRMLLNIEETLISCGEFESDFAYIVAQKRNR